jgi:hypothetical protein
VVTELSEFEDGPPNVEPPRSYPEHGPTLTPPPPAPEKRETLSPADADRVMVRAALTNVAETMAEFRALLPGLATKDDLGDLATKADLRSIDIGVATAHESLGRIEAKLDEFRRDVHLWLFGDKMRPGLAQGIDASNQLAGDALESASQAKRLAKATYNGVFHAELGLSDEEREAREAIK